MRTRLFWKDTSGASAVEFALITPLVLFFLFGALTIFDLYRSYANVVQANFIVSDMITRETAIDKAYLDRLYGAYAALVSADTKPTALRITSLLRTKNRYEVQWTVERGDKGLIPPQTQPDKNIPDIAELDSVIHVEGFQKQRPLMALLGGNIMTFTPDAYIRPRFISAIALTN